MMRGSKRCGYSCVTCSERVDHTNDAPCFVSFLRSSLISAVKTEDLASCCLPLKFDVLRSYQSNNTCGRCCDRYECRVGGQNRSSASTVTKTNDLRAFEG